MEDRIKRTRPGRKLEAEKRRIAKGILRDYLMDHHEELPRKVVLAIMQMIVQTRQTSQTDKELHRRIYGQAD